MVLSVASGKPKLGSGGSMVAKLKLKGIDGKLLLPYENYEREKNDQCYPDYGTTRHLK